MSALASGYPKSVNPGHPDIDSFPTSWKRYPITLLLDQVERPIALEPLREYQLVVAKRNRGGIAPREVRLGREVLTPKQYLLETGDFVIARRQIAHGACGFVPELLSGSIVSSEYDVFRVNEEVLLPAFLELLTHSNYFQQICFHSSVGVNVEKLVFDTGRFVGRPLAVPSIKQQLLAIRLFEDIGNALRTTDALIDAKQEFKRGLMQVVLTGKQRFPGLDKSGRIVRFGDVATRGTERTGSPGPSGLARRCIELEHIESGTGRLLGSISSSEVSSQKTVFHSGDSLFGKLRPYLRKFTRPDFEGICSSEIWVLTPKGSSVSSAFLYLLIQGEAVARAATATSGSKMPRASWAEVARAQVWIPPRDEQNKYVELFSAIDTELLHLRALTEQLREQKRGLLQRLFSGELDLFARSADSVHRPEVPA